MLSKSERLLELWCTEAALEFRRVEEVVGEKRPDYEIITAACSIVVEVKQFDPNEREREQVRKLEAGEAGAFYTTPGKRLRNAIGSARRQLRTLSGGRLPAMLVVYNNVLGCTGHTSAYAVAVAMQGVDVVPVQVPIDPSEEPVFGDVRSGPKRQMTPKSNTSISAIGVLSDSNPSGLFLSVYHNRFAAVQLDPDLLRSRKAAHFRLSDRAESSFDSWEAV